MKKSCLFWMIATLWLSGCTGNGVPRLIDAAETASETRSHAESMARVHRLALIVTHPYPTRVSAVIEGVLPDGCTCIHQVTQERQGRRFFLRLQTRRPTEAVCTQALTPFNKTIPLHTEGLAAGTYTVHLGELTAAFGIKLDNTD